VPLRVDVQPEFFPWAVERARLDWDDLVFRFKRLPEWVTGKSKPTFKQLQSFASATHAPIGFFFLPQPPEEPLPLADFRTLEGADVGPPSADLLDTIYICQQRQDWFREFALTSRMEPLPFIGSTNVGASPEEVAREVSKTLGFDVEKRRACASWDEAFRHLVGQCEDNGILIMVNGVVGNNTRRVLDIGEFRGFCLSDRLAPVVFVNGADSKSAQMFTLVHEVAHLWLGDVGVSNASLAAPSARVNEIWCNAVAAEVLVPRQLLLEAAGGDALREKVARLTRSFKVSSLVILRRLFDVKLLNGEHFQAAYAAEVTRLKTLKEGTASGGSFYNTEAVRVSKRFATAILVSTLEGTTLFRDAARLLGIKKVSTLNEFAARLGVNS
jgi:Zn-dependent peptidase ImmA (M78 family)